MFLFRWLKKLLVLALAAVGLFWAAHYKVGGVPVYQKAKSYVASEDFRQSWKDFKMFFGGMLKSLGEEILEDVTDEDRKELDKMIQKKAGEKYGNGGF
ncbi:MAG: hypothetical protein HY466_00030 [Deltaproteobacteria bacterium]|nr:hypothetical protein [Deltaproteobacteria bacterium]